MMMMMRDRTQTLSSYTLCTVSSTEMAQWFQYSKSKINKYKASEAKTSTIPNNKITNK
jgi:hypothetical protein